ncbi:MAG: DUF262 domain-containing protein [Enterocloster asparagiformis]|nr:DUF262 domain-containing protein [Enterocloster asparagiformis]
MNAFKSNIFEYMNGTRQYSIPIYQRVYSWGTEQCQRLWTDVVSMQKEKRIGHFVGSIVRIDEVSAAGFPKAQIIDGQQRLTTLTLLLIALRDFVKQNSVPTEINADEITDTLLINTYKRDNDRYKLLLTKTDQDMLKKLVENIDLSQESASRIVSNYDFFLKQISKGDLTPDEIYQSIGKLQMVDIALDRQYDDPQAIFESLNSTGMDLKDSDLIRNFVLMGLPGTKQELIYNNIWRPMEELFVYGNQAKMMDNFLRDYLTMQLGRLVNQNDVYKEFKIYRNTYWEEKTEKLCEDLLSYARYYAQMDSGESNDANLKALYIDLKTIGLSVAYPFLMKVHADCRNGTITKDMLQEIVSICVNYALRRSICGMRTTGLNYMFAVLKNSIRETDYLNSIKAFFVLQESSKEFPGNKRFAEEFVIQDIYSKRICKFVLCKLETWNGHKIVSLDDLSVEHVFPQKPKPIEWGTLSKELLHTIGNLTLAHWSDNSALSNKPFIDKLTISQGYKQSALRLNEYIVEQTEWGEEQILERARKLAQLAEKVWPYPQLSEDELRPYQPEPEREYQLNTYKYYGPTNKTLFEILDGRIKKLGTTISRTFNKDYVAYKLDTNFVDVELQKTRLHIWVNMRFSEIADPKGLCRDVSGVGHLGNGEVELFFDFNTPIDDVMAIIEQSFRHQDIE